jgi:hypothetical protein
VVRTDRGIFGRLTLESLLMGDAPLKQPKTLAEPHALAYCNLCVEDAYTKFCEELAGREFKDQRGTVITIFEENFPKLIGMKRRDPVSGELLRNGKGEPIKAKASVVLDSLRSKTFDRNLYWIDSAKLRTMFWIPDAVCNADALHPNIARRVEGDRVYLKRYAKLRGKVKLVFTNKARRNRIVITSFVVEQRTLGNYVSPTVIWVK